MNKKLIRTSLVGAVFTIGAFAAAFHANVIHFPFQADVHTQNVVDFQNDKALMGASHNVFVGRVVKQVGTKTRVEVPETQFSVEVVSNIKGNLTGTVVVDQFGGYKNGVLYVVDGESAHEVDGTTAGAVGSTTGLLEIGKTYLFATRYSVDEKWYTLISDPAAKKMLSSDFAKDSRVIALQKAYKNEILLDADVQAKTTFNSYKSLKIK
jgi:hypothetical protein